MLRKLTYVGLAGCLLMLATSAAIPSPQEAKEEKPAEGQKAPKDQQEYELISKAFAKETPPQEKLKYLDEWKQKYPETAYEIDRLRIYVASYQQTNQGRKATEAAKELLTKVPGDFSALYTVASQTPFLEKTTDAEWKEGEKAAQELIGGGVQKQFEASNKPPNVTQEQWDTAKQQTLGTVHQTMGWVAMQRKDHVKAEQEFLKSLQANPNSGQVSYWLGQEVLAQANADKNEMALFSFARAATYDGPGALPPAGRQQLNDYLVKVYTKYTGTEEGLAELKAKAATSALPPPDLKIESAEVRKFKEEQERRKEDPLLYAFVDLKNTLLSPKGDATWGNLKGKLTPQMRLFVVSSDSARPTTLHLSSKKGGPVEVVLDLENRLRSAPGVGTKVKFEGVAASLSKNPFQLGLTDGKVL
jgi:tetratricopeptide (TPR) repeat protein